MADLLRRQELAHHLKPTADRLTDLGERVQEVRKAILSQAEVRYAAATAGPVAQTMDRAWRLSSYLRGLLARGGPFGGEDGVQARTDLASSESVAWMGGWQPLYTDEGPSQERLAETVIKLEREVYQTKRPRQLARRDLFLRIGEPIDVSHSSRTISGTHRRSDTVSRNDSGTRSRTSSSSYPRRRAQKRGTQTRDLARWASTACSSRNLGT